MASIRDSILTTLVTRLSSIPGWTSALRSGENPITGPVCAIVYPVGETKRLANSQAYDCSYRVEVAIVCRSEDASPSLDGGNPFRYLDRMLTEAEKRIHAPDSWGMDPAFTDVQIDGHEVLDPTEDNELLVRLLLTFRYRHDYQDPGA